MSKKFLIPIGVAALGLTGVGTEAKPVDALASSKVSTENTAPAATLEISAEGKKSFVDYQIGNDLHQVLMIQSPSGVVFAGHGSHSSHSSHSSHRSGR